LGRLVRDATPGSAPGPPAFAGAGLPSGLRWGSACPCGAQTGRLGRGGLRREVEFDNWCRTRPAGGRGACPEGDRTWLHAWEAACLLDAPACRSRNAPLTTVRKWRSRSRNVRARPRQRSSAGRQGGGEVPARAAVGAVRAPSE
jgi:hypothetical protein